MVIVEVKGKSFYMDGYLKSNLDFVVDKVLNKNNMCVTVIDGRVGTGKSTIACQLGYYCSNGGLTLADETFDANQFTERINKSTKGNNVICDEAFLLLNKRATLSSQNRILLALMQQMRIRQVFVWIVLPSVYDLDKNLILNLADFFIHCYSKPFGRRGQFAVYDRTGLKKLWLYGRQAYSYSQKIAMPNFRGRFTKYFPLDMKEYEKKKIKALQTRVHEDRAADNKYIRQRNQLAYHLKEQGEPIEKIGKLIGLKKNAVYKMLAKKQEVKNG